MESTCPDVVNKLTLFFVFILTIAGSACHADKHTWQKPYPQTSAGEIQILVNKGYITGYSNCRRSALWVSYPLEKKHYEKWPKRRPAFKEDQRTQSHVTPDDYWLSGFDRGHLAPGYAVWAVSGAKAREETYLMSNIVPQRKRLNQKLWQRLEEVAADHFTRYFSHITVYTGPVYEHTPDYTDSGLAIPGAFYKIFSAYQHDRLYVLGFIMPQTVHGKESLDDFVVSIDTIEEKTGIDFFHWLDHEKQQAIESNISTVQWNLENLSDLPGRY